MTKHRALQFFLPQDFVDLLDQLVEARAPSASKMTMLEWNRTPSGLAYWRDLQMNPKYLSWSNQQLTEYQKSLYRKDVPSNMGRPNKHNARVAVLREALEALASVTSGEATDA